MKKVLKLDIAEPCGENWKAFPKLQDGLTVKGHCASCNKHVIDFTSWSDEQIREYFTSTTDRVCGKMRKDQFKTYLEPAKPRRTLKNAIAITLGTIIFFSSKVAESQITRKASVSTMYYSNQLTNLVNAKRIPYCTISGTVTDTEGLPLPGVNVTRKNNKDQTVTDVDGKYELHIGKPGKNETLIFQFVGLQTYETRFEIKGTSEIVNAELSLDIGFLGEVIVTRTISPRRWWWNFKDLFR